MEVGSSVAISCPKTTRCPKCTFSVRTVPETGKLSAVPFSSSAVPETEITSVSVGQDAKIQVPALGRKVLTGTVDEKGIMANPFSRSYDVKLNVKDTDSGLMPGMVVEVSLLSSAQKTDSQCIIPANIVQLDERNNNFIWVNKNGRATKRIIRCGDYMANGVTVLSGLSAGDQIIVKGQHKVCEGTEVNL